MAEILEFRADGKCDTRQDRPAGPAEVVIFPGVRIERGSFSLADRLSEPSRPAGGARISRAKNDD